MKQSIATLRGVRYRKDGRAGRLRMATVSNGRSFSWANEGHSPSVGIAMALRDALDPRTAPKAVKTFADMSESERAEMRRLYERK
jgi:hypothetical protein